MLMMTASSWFLLLALIHPVVHSSNAEPILPQQQHQQSTFHNSSSIKTNQLQVALQQAATNKPPNYLETSRQITNILDKFMSLGYDKRVRPNYGGPPVEVNVTMRILSISSVSEVMMDFTADFYFRQTWHDPRLAFKKLDNIKTLYVGAEVSKKIWLPDTFFGNEKLAYFHEATTPNVFLRIDHSGEVYRSIRLTVTSSCPMNLQYFPMDRQRCTIEAESYGYNVKDIIYRWARKDTAVERDKEISLPQFDIVKTVQKYRLEELSSGTYSRLIAEIHFARRMGYYLIQIYIPSSLIVVISWVSFWLHRNASPARVQLGVTTVLTMTTLMSSTNAALPKISYVKSIDIFLGTCFVMVFAALLEYATVGYLGKRIAMRKAQLQHAQSQAQARLFALAQAQGAQGDLVAPGIQMAGASSSGTPNLFDISGPSLAVGQYGLGLEPAAPPLSAPQAQPGPAHALRDHEHEHAHMCEHKACSPVPPPRAPNRQSAISSNANKCTCVHSSSCQTRGCESQTLPRHITFNREPASESHGHDHDHEHNHGRNRHHLLHHQHDARHAHQLAAQTLQDQHADPHQHHHHRHHCGGHASHQDCTGMKHCKSHQHQPCVSQSAGAACCSATASSRCSAGPWLTGCPAACQVRDATNNQPAKSLNHLLQMSPEAGAHKGAQAAATAAAATFVNMHRRNKGLPPSTNPNFAHYMNAWSGPYNRAMETIFGIRPSDIDKYSRVVFPVCFVCFQLMYWIVYLHISAFIETGEPPTDQLQPQSATSVQAAAMQQQHQQQQQFSSLQPSQVPLLQQQHFQALDHIDNTPFQYQLTQPPS